MSNIQHCIESSPVRDSLRNVSSQLESLISCNGLHDSGPGSYNQVGIGQESMKKAYIESTRRGVFGTTSARINAMVKKDDYYLPGPAHYAVKEAGKVNEPKHKNPMGVFSSMSHRVHEDTEAKVRQL